MMIMMMMMITNRDGNTDKRACVQWGGKPLEEILSLVIIFQISLGGNIVVLCYSTSEVLQRLGQLSTIQSLIAAIQPVRQQ